ncbi:MAG TPA: tetratricopeptide repeat protein [Ignavibacteriales bacterium]|nr:tetratricopeptide repeat protein [Ignavibacteriales bacterium]
MNKKFYLIVLIILFISYGNDKNREIALEHFGKGAYEMEQKNYTKAIEEFQISLQYDPNNHTTYNYLGNCYDYINEFDEAIRCYLKSIDIEENAYAYNNLGNSYTNKSDYKKAEEYYKKAIDLDPKYAPPLYNLGKLYFFLRREKEGLEYIKKAAGLTYKPAQKFLKEYSANP